MSLRTGLPAVKPPQRGVAGVKQGSRLPLDLEPNLQRDLELRDLAVLDPAAFTDNLKPIHVEGEGALSVQRALGSYPSAPSATGCLPFGTQCLSSAIILYRHRHQPLSRIGDVITGSVADWIGVAQQPDDVTVVLGRARSAPLTIHQWPDCGIRH